VELRGPLSRCCIIRPQTRFTLLFIVSLHGTRMRGPTCDKTSSLKWNSTALLGRRHRLNFGSRSWNFARGKGAIMQPSLAFSDPLALLWRG
jgi:hypothetical protein